MEIDEFEKLIHEGYQSIPEKFRKKIKNVAVLVENDVSDDLRRQEKLSKGETLLGLYQGIPETQRGAGYGIGPTLPDTITLFKQPIERAAGGNPGRIKELVAEVVLHECAHYFGMSEAEVRRWEKLRKREAKPSSDQKSENRNAGQ